MKKGEAAKTADVPKTSTPGSAETSPRSREIQGARRADSHERQGEGQRRAERPRDPRGEAQKNVEEAKKDHEEGRDEKAEAQKNVRGGQEEAMRMGRREGRGAEEGGGRPRRRP
jgi:hypothetical protein